MRSITPLGTSHSSYTVHAHNELQYPGHRSLVISANGLPNDAVHSSISVLPVRLRFCKVRVECTGRTHSYIKRANDRGTPPVLLFAVIRHCTGHSPSDSSSHHTLQPIGRALQVSCRLRRAYPSTQFLGRSCSECASTLSSTVSVSSSSPSIARGCTRIPGLRSES